MSVSWLQIERYALDEVDPEERATIEVVLAEDAEVRAMLDAIRADERPLPTLEVEEAPAAVVAPSVEAAPAPLPAPANRRVWLGVGGLLAVAAAVGLVIVGVAPPTDGLPGPERSYKGGTLAVELARERGGAVVEAPGDVVAGDRFLVRLTCPPGERPWDVVVFSEGEAFFPLEPDAPVQCGNRVALPGAFVVDSGAPLTVCAVVDGVPARSEVAAQGIAVLGEDAVCTAVPTRHP